MKARISTLAMGVALAFSTPAFAQGQCVWEDSADAFAATGDGNLTHSEAVRRAMASQPGRAALANVPAACSNVEAETLRREGVTGTALIPNGTTFSFGLRVPRLAAAPAQPSVNAGGAQSNLRSGGGAALDAEIAELRRQRESGEASPEVLARLTALEARPAVAPTGPDLRPQIGRLERQYNDLRRRPPATLNSADRRLLQQLPGQIAAMRNAQKAAEKARNEAQTAATTANGAATTATTASAAAQGHSTAAAASASWLEGHKWLIYLALALGTISLLWAGLLQWKKASKKEVRTTVVISDESRKALDAATDGDKVPVELFEKGVSYCVVEFQKAADGSFHPTADIGDTNAGTPVRDVEAFLRRCYWQRRAVLNDFR